LTISLENPKIKLDKNPLIILLHGYGSNEEDLFSFAAELPSNPISFHVFP
jgi:phospholipase/carboxylesterase